MALTVTQATQHAISYIKAGSTYGTSEELLWANTVQSVITSYRGWHWMQTAGTNIAVTLASGQPYTMAAGDQNKVQSIAQANLLSGSTQLPNLIVFSDPVVPLTSTTGQPIGVSLTSPTTIRLWPAPDASYTFQWRYYLRPVVITVNSATWDTPDSFNNVVKAGMKWQVMEWADDLRAEAAKTEFYEELARLAGIDQRAMES